MNLNLLVSIIIYALMAFFVGCGFYHIVNLSKYQKDFALIGKRIKTDAQAVIDLQEYLEGTTSEQNKLFQSDKLNAKLEEYRAAYQRTKSTSFAAPFVDITDFFNGEFLDELGHTGFCELVPGTMTGLGILGTFVGLVLGVGGFDTSTTDAVMVSITHLLGGMSTAFLTSIVGVLLSLAFSHIYKKYVDSTNQSLEDFVTAFHDKNLDGSSSNAENQLLGYQQQQTELMKNFATVVSEAVSTSIANTMRTELVPIFDEMKSIALPPNVKSLGEMTFLGCTSLNMIRLNVGLTSIRQGAFLSCTSLKEIHIPSTVTLFGEHLFEYVPIHKANGNAVIYRSRRQNLNLLIYCALGSHALEYAQRNNIEFRVERH